MQRADSVICAVEPRKTRQSSAKEAREREGERRNLVSEITEFYSKLNSTPVQMPPCKMSGKNCEKEKERQRDLKEARQNIKQYIETMNKDDLNGNGQSSGMHSLEGAHDHDNDRENNGEANNLCSPVNDNSNLESDSNNAIKDKEKEAKEASTQTSDDKILSAIKELAAKYQEVDKTLNEPKNGISDQLAKTQHTVSELYSEIHGAVSGIKVQLKQVTDKATDNMKKISEIANSQSRMSALLDENKRLVKELQIMQGLVQKVSAQAEHSSHQIMDLTRRGMEQNLIVHGIDDTFENSTPSEDEAIFTTKEKCKMSFLKFLKEELNVSLEIEDVWKAHRTGVKQPNKVRPMVVKVAYSAKDLIMDHVASLKGRFNPITKQKYFIGEQIPEGLVELKKQTAARVKTLRDANEKKPKADCSKILVLNDKILVDDKLDSLAVSPPQPSQLFLGGELQSTIDAIQDHIIQSEPETIRNSEFLALATKVYSIQDVQNAYIAVAQRYPAADHIMLGYALKENDKLRAGACDDREYGAGSRIRNLIFEHKAKDTAIFVVRKYGGIHLGFGCFQAIEKVALKALQMLNHR